ncbi:MAG: fluoride efflux transporter CrcB [Oceanospirillaceae bacterium]|nr:fluoride efflux transporter CrcB [Oceanospirillaceae bacterium]MBT5629845.1 fluoride efflux transporter CrcB [Oceanospirillaceae bacterium]MBT6101935.1 fluoride efflux transporter CrcB [Oceanospirillaceae bacterium]MBT7674576.1 fluoride efflux transporter CrcB [Oceanospirillaceae bacterium]HAW17325.1 fluoride efflux transporter CrcB [Oceanospirillaceae bacterium]
MGVQLIAIACGGAIGALSRFGLQQWLAPMYSGRFPLAIFIANSIGSLCIGLIYVLIVERGMLPEVWRAFLMVGLLGAFTTFSAFSLDSLRLIEQGEGLIALSNIFANVVVGLISAFIGMSIGRWL